MKTEFLTLILKVTNKCNLNCPYCYTKSTIHNGQDMDLNTFKNAVVKGASSVEKELTVIFHGGEPTLRSYEWFEEALNFLNHIEEIYNIKIHKALQTNLTLFDEKKFKLFKSRNVGIGFSYDGITNDLTRQNNDLIINNYNKIISKPFNIITGCIALITKDNYDKLIEMVEDFQSKKILYDLHLVFNTITMEDDKANMNIDLVIEKYKEFIDYIFSKENYSIPSTITNFINYIVSKKKGLCELIDCRKHWLGISPEGKVVPCGNEWLQKNEEYLFGNINTDSIDDIFNCSNYQKFSNKIDKKINICKNCEIFDFCNSGCPAKDFSNTGDVGNHDVKTCKLTKEIYKHIQNKILSKDFKNNNIIRMVENEK